jgi:type I restriction enzyme S subunit
LSTLIDAVIQHTIGGGWGSQEPQTGDIPVSVIRGADFPDIEIHKVSRLPQRYEPPGKVSTRALRKGDIVLETSGGTSERPTGRTVLISQKLIDESPGVLIPASFCRLLRIDEAKACPEFVYYALQALYEAGGTWEFQNQSTGISNFQFEIFRKRYVLPAIGLEEQRAIAEVLGALDDKIAANTKLAQLMEDLLEAEVGEKWLGHRRDENTPELIPISDLFEINPKIKRSTEQTPIYVDMKKLPEASSGIVEWDHRTAQGGARFQQGDTLMARITPCLQNRKTGFVDFLADDEIAVGSTEFIVMRSLPGVAKPISYFVAVNSDFRDFAIRHMVGTSGRQRVSAADIALYNMPRPNPEWLSDFGRRAERQFELMKSLRDENRTLSGTRDTLLPQLMSGKLRVKDAERAIEAAL